MIIDMIIPVRSVLLVAVLALSGCGWWVSSPGIPTADAGSLKGFGASGVAIDCVRPDRWRSGGTIGFLPFTPGPGTEAGPGADRASLLLVKGIMGGLSGGERFRAVTGAGSAPDFLFKGRVETLTPPARWVLVGPLRHPGVIRMRGDILERGTGEVVARVTGTRSFRQKRDADDEAVALGWAVAVAMER